MKQIYLRLLIFCLAITANAQIINIPDPVFKSKLLNNNLATSEFSDINGQRIIVDTNHDGEIQESEAHLIGTLYFNQASPYVTNLTGVEHFINLKRLFLGPSRIANLNLSGLSNLIEINYYNDDYNTTLASINLTGLVNLEHLMVRNGRLTSLNLTGLTNLKYIQCQHNLLTNLDVQGLPKLEILECRNNQLTNLNLSSNPLLRELYCSYNNLNQLILNGLSNLRSIICTSNNLSSIDISDCGLLYNLTCDENQLTSIDLTNQVLLNHLRCNQNLLTNLNVDVNTNLTHVFCNNNRLTTLDLSNQSNLVQVNCSDNPFLESLFTKNGKNEMLEFLNNYNLKYICSDDSQVLSIQNAITYYNFSNCHVNSYCSFTPGGTFYTIQGNSRYDQNSDGCELTDTNYPNLRLLFSNGTNSASLISDSSGAYHYDVQSGTYTITPTLESSSYFIVSPASVSVTFPTQSSPFSQDFCISANGVHPDLEITLIPLNIARPGFDSKYKLILKNKGTETQSGTVVFTFDDSVLDFVSSNPVNTNQSVNNLSWDFFNLLPFKTKEIELTLNVNSPVETPPVNSGDILNFTANITSSTTDETPADNVVQLNQTVFNSFDPNDKTCLEGTVISPSEAGKYVHYMIRFENTGTFPAENIVVKDMIDQTKFDISSLLPIKGSHPFVTNISSGNKVEFIFENINLPFDDANNDGYVVFKIKTKPTLVVGDTFSNSANIYFDYNAPILTNTATTEIQNLSNSDFDLSNYFQLYPNPAKNSLNIETKGTLEIYSIRICNALGQLFLSVPYTESSKSIDISNLASGNYFLKIFSNKGTSNIKFIKN